MPATTTQSHPTIIPQEPRQVAVARHETFHLRDGWLTKAMAAITADAAALHHKDAHHELGVGINMLRAIRYWVEATGLAQPMLDLEQNVRRSSLHKLTELGELIWDYDPYLEDAATLWVIHGTLASQQRLAPAWYWLFNLSPSPEFNAKEIEHKIGESVDALSERTIHPGSIRKDIRCLVRSYTRPERAGRVTAGMDSLGCPLATLNLITPTAIPETYRLVVGQHRSLPVEIFLYFTYRFAAGDDGTSGQIGFDDLRWRPGSPGRLLCLDAETIREYMSRAQLTYGTSVAQEIRTAGLNWVQLDARPPLEFFRDYYSDGHRG